MKIETTETGHKIVKRYRKGYCFACIWTSETPDKNIKHDMVMGEANFFPYNESTAEFRFDLGNGRPLHFRK